MFYSVSPDSRGNMSVEGGRFNHHHNMSSVPIKNLSGLAVQAELARRAFPDFVRFIHPRLAITPFHGNYYRVLDRFARGEIRKLIVTIPPQHGKSQGASVMLPAYLLGLNPDLRIAIASYNLTLATKFNRQVQRVIDSGSYARVFPGTRLKQSASKEKNYIRTADEFEIIGRDGGLLSVGREGTLTGNPVDVMIIDDLYKDALEANSPLIRDNTWEWYMSVVKTRLHNDSRELVVMTRWSEDDLVGRIGRKEKVVEITALDMPEFIGRSEDLSELARGGYVVGGEDAVRVSPSWFRLNFEAIKEGKSTALDPREPGEALWPERQGIGLLREKRALDPQMFGCLYQGNPTVREGLLYGDSFMTYTSLPDEIVKKGNYTDTADTGEDYLCSVCYEVAQDGRVYITDLVYSQQGMEYTEEAVAAMLNRNVVRVASVESNNGGRGFARNVGKMCRLTKVEWFSQTANKESRILTNQATVLKYIVMPADWRERWDEFYCHITGYRRVFRANRFHDAADVLTGIVEREVVNRVDKSLKMVRFAL